MPDLWEKATAFLDQEKSIVMSVIARISVHGYGYIIEEGKNLVEQCGKLGVGFSFTAKGGRASKKRPSWYSVS